MEIRLWTTKEKPLTVRSDYAKGRKSAISLNFFKYGASLGLVGVYVKHDGEEYFSSEHFMTGAEVTLQLGYTCIYHDGYWKRLSLGPFFITWWSPNGEETE